MTPEEFFHFDKLSQNTIYEMRMLDLYCGLKISDSKFANEKE